MINLDTEVFYFGCWDRSGHYLFNRHGCHPADSRTFERIGEKHLDGNFAPHLQHRRPDSSYCDCPQVEGSAAITHAEGWTVLGFWDRSVDHRGASNSNFVVKGTHSFADMVAIAREHFPKIWSRFTFEVKLHNPVAKTPSELEIERLKDLIDRDRTGLAAGLVEVKRIAAGFDWICEGRGPYAYDDDRYRMEVGSLITQVITAADKALVASGDRAREAFLPRAKLTADALREACGVAGDG